MLKRTLFVTLSVLALGACGGPGQNATVPEAQPAGATSESIGEHTVHFSAITTDQLTPEVASAFNIVRSKNRAMLNVSVIRNSDSVPVTAEVAVKVVNLTGQLKSVTMLEKREPGEIEAIYYIGDTTVANRETLVFDIDVTPEGVDATSRVRFKREFYTD